MRMYFESRGLCACLCDNSPIKIRGLKDVMHVSGEQGRVYKDAISLEAEARAVHEGRETRVTQHKFVHERGIKHT